MNKNKIRRLLVGELSGKRLIVSLVFICASVYVFISLYAYFLSDRMIFLPQKSSYEDGLEIIKIKAKDSVCISALYLSNADSDFTILHSHGNAEDIGQLRPFLERLCSKGFSVLAYDYRGYGTSEGRATEKGVYKDIEAAYEYLVTEQDTEPKSIIVMGRSVGGAVAIHLAHRKKIAGLIIESSFVTAFQVMTRIPVLAFDKFRNIDKIKEVRCPVLVIHGKDDRIIALWHGKRLFEVANEPKLALWVEGAGHNDLVRVTGSDYWEVISQFTKLIKSERRSFIQ